MPCCLRWFVCQPKNRGKTPKWMVKIMGKHPMKIHDLGVPLFLETPICLQCFFFWMIDLVGDISEHHQGPKFGWSNSTIKWAMKGVLYYPNFIWPQYFFYRIVKCMSMENTFLKVSGPKILWHGTWKPLKVEQYPVTLPPIIMEVKNGSLQ